MDRISLALLLAGLLMGCQKEVYEVRRTDPDKYSVDTGGGYTTPGTRYEVETGGRYQAGGVAPSPVAPRQPPVGIGTPRKSASH
jgi:hypothetical protein